MCDLEGRFLDQVGGNGAALRDGAFEAAAFNRPQGVAYSARRNCLYVADTENNALREVCLSSPFPSVPPTSTLRLQPLKQFTEPHSVYPAAPPAGVSQHPGYHTVRASHQHLHRSERYLAIMI